MFTRCLILPIFIAAFAPSLSVAVAAQDVPAVTDSEPTGFALFLQADAVQKSDPTIGAAMGRQPTLTQRRAAYDSPAFQKSLSLLRQALAKGVHLSGEPQTLSYTAKARNFLRMLLIEQNVLLADGRTGAAVDSFEDGLQIGDIGKSPEITLSYGLTSCAMDTMQLNEFARHLNQLSARDCERLLAAMQRRLKAPDSAPQRLENERVSMHQYAQGQFRAALNRSGHLNIGSDRDDNLDEIFALPADQWEALRTWKNDEAAQASVRAEIDSRVDAVYDRAAEMLRDPALASITAQGSVTATQAKAGVSEGYAQVQQIADAVVATIQPDVLYWTCEQSISDTARMRLFAALTALRRYRWEHSQYPHTLAEIGASPLLLNDPFTGQPLVYSYIDRDTFTLQSVGPPARDASGHTEGVTVRAPITLPGSPYMAIPPLRGIDSVPGPRPAPP